MKLLLKSGAVLAFMAAVAAVWAHLATGPLQGRLIEPESIANAVSARNLYAFQFRTRRRSAIAIHNVAKRQTVVLHSENHQLYRPLFVDGDQSVFATMTPDHERTEFRHEVPPSKFIECSLPDLVCKTVFTFKGAVSGAFRSDGGILFSGLEPGPFADGGMRTAYMVPLDGNLFFSDGGKPVKLTNFRRLGMRIQKLNGDWLFVAGGLFNTLERSNLPVEVKLSGHSARYSVRLSGRQLVPGSIKIWPGTGNVRDRTPSLNPSGILSALLSFNSDNGKGHLAAPGAATRMTVWDHVNKKIIFETKVRNPARLRPVFVSDRVVRYADGDFDYSAEPGDIAIYDYTVGTKAPVIRSLIEMKSLASDDVKREVKLVD